MQVEKEWRTRATAKKSSGRNSNRKKTCGEMAVEKGAQEKGNVNTYAQLSKAPG